MLRTHRSAAGGPAATGSARVGLLRPSPSSGNEPVIQSAAPSIAPVPAESSGARGTEPPSILLLTKNEEINIEACIRGLDFSDDIVVLDSYSTDRTVELASKFP